MSTLADVQLPVAEHFYSIQGEGPTAGTPAVFLRTGGCNLLCGAPDDPDAPQEELEPNEAEGATWVCDTIETWRNPDTLSLSDLIATWRSEGWLDRLESGAAHLVLTGGEPMLRQETLSELLTSLNIKHVEIETNGTILPMEIDPHIDQYNVSLKLSNSGMSHDRRINPESIEAFVTDPRTTFKFVVSRQQDLTEIHDLRDEYDIDAADIMLMPAGASQDKLAVTSETVAELCMEYGYHYTPRLQVDIWNQATGV